MRLLKLCEADEEKLQTFIEAIDGDFKPSISSQIDLRSYAHKLLMRGEVIAAIDTNQRVLGAIGVYCNDHKNGVGYISILGVAKEMRTKGLGSALLDAGLSRCSKARMARVIACAHQDNQAALKMYKSRGFREEKNLKNSRLRLTRNLLS